MSLTSDRIEVEGVVNRLLDNLSLAISSKTGREGAAMRRQIGEVRANFAAFIKAGTFAAELLDCFEAAYTANVKLAALTIVRNGLFAETPVGEIGAAIVQMAIGFCLSTESRLIVLLEFNSRVDVELMMATMKAAFDTARERAADSSDSTFYKDLTYLAGALTNHLATVARPMPRMISFQLPATMPALAVSNRVYYTADRWEEIVAENKTIHPAFCQRDIRGLSS